MKLYPAIDIKDGQCVRLRQGSYDDKTVYDDKPWKVAKEFEAAGAKFIHLVDLDGAREGRSVNDEAVREIIENVGIPVEIGGGIRTTEDISNKLNLGVSRVIIGTEAVRRPEFVKESILEFGAEKIVVGIDAKDGKVAVSGWEEISRISAVDLALLMKDMGVKTIIYTDISKDGMLAGPNIEQTKKLAEETGLNVVASGGVSSADDLRNLDKAGVYGAILGKAIYEHKVDLKEVAKEFE
ncbi:MAG: 1-(5-phosphoribosyl)-5-[(5-phosphoribosylamino)methylideneamino]imidazole-4-carboxamide isomerase [Lachnospiraceae bacterium]|nr:1-(5-phosphoribosyl)-5-[(5-phosphoribosylamino)methylideneamino]imidazole-4-carboxamide isomerase [Lachnospiraceae bacterium]